MLKSAFAALAVLLALPAPAAPPARPRLIVAISVDQYSADLFAQYRQTYTGGMKRLAHAIVFPAGFQSHAATETCPGHSTILTGSHPARTGIIANEWSDMGRTRPGRKPNEVYCAEDESRPGTTSDAGSYFVSPVHLRVPTMGDRLKRADPRSRVVAVAGKDRAAVMMGGHMTDAIWYFDPKPGATAYVTLPDRAVPVPPVVAQVNARLPQLVARPPAFVIPASCAAKVRPVRALPDGPTVGAPAASDRPAFRASAAFDAATAEIAIGLIDGMKLGRGPATDLIAIGLSANDYVGHYYGPGGAEMCAFQQALDATVGRILAALDTTGVPYAVVLTADHGGLDLPERQRASGAPDAARADPALEPAAMGAAIAQRLGLDAKPLWTGSLEGDWYLSRQVPPALRPQVIAATRAALLASPQVEAVLTADDIARQAPPRPPVDDWTLLEKARASFDPARSGDLVVFLKPRVIPIARPKSGSAVATHGSPWNYDRRVPMLFSYPGATPFEQPLSVETVDILPTLAALVGLPVPADEIDGRCLDLDPGPASTCPAERTR